MKSESNYEYIYQKLVATLEKSETTPRLKTTPLNLQRFEKVAYIKAFQSKVWSLQVKPKEIVRGEPANICTAGIGYSANYKIVSAELLSLMAKYTALQQICQIGSQLKFSICSE